MTHPFQILDPARPSRDFAGKCALAVMAKAPRPGKVKTRLSPPLTPEQASDLNACFLRDTVACLHEATLAALAEWVISYTPQGEEAAFAGILPERAFLLPQRGVGFGERLLTTAEDLFACGFSAVCLIDSDSPTVPSTEFVTATQRLLSSEECAILGPSEDGGYYLIGLQQPHPQLFERISWSTDLVTAQTLDRAAGIDLQIHLLRQWYDVDDESSFSRLQSELLDPQTMYPRGYAAPHTRAYITRLPRQTHSTFVKVETTV